MIFSFLEHDFFITQKRMGNGESLSGTVDRIERATHRFSTTSTLKILLIQRG